MLTLQQNFVFTQNFARIFCVTAFSWESHICSRIYPQSGKISRQNAIGRVRLAASQRQWLWHRFWHVVCLAGTCNDERVAQEERYDLHFRVGPKSPEWSKRAFGPAWNCALDSPRRLTGCLGRNGGMDGSRPRDFRLCASVNVYTFYRQSPFLPNPAALYKPRRRLFPKAPLRIYSRDTLRKIFLTNELL